MATKIEGMGEWVCHVAPFFFDVFLSMFFYVFFCAFFLKKKQRQQDTFFLFPHVYCPLLNTNDNDEGGNDRVEMRGARSTVESL